MDRSCPQLHPLSSPEGLAHGGLDVQRADVLPVLLQERDQEVDSVHDVGADLLLGHADMADGDSHAQHLLQLELDGGLGLSDLANVHAGADINGLAPPSATRDTDPTPYSLS